MAVRRVEAVVGMEVVVRRVDRWPGGVSVFIVDSACSFTVEVTVGAVV